jgi:4-amino-4-deoxy-L-arabinose transferase-like glycosyltransferase
MNKARSMGLLGVIGKLPPAVLLVLATLICLGPFVSKPLHIDDPLFVWTARHIQANPASDFYGFSINGYGWEMPISDVQKNPPLVSYYMALAASLVGWSEVALHLVFLLPALAAVLGAYQLAREFVSRPGLAALAGLCTPAFIVSGTTLMCDVPMLAFWLWAMFFWIRGIKNGENAKLLVSALLIACCALTKYYGIVLVPLLFAYTLAKTRRLGKWALFFLIPLAVLATYQWLTQELYQNGLISSAMSYASVEHPSGGILTEGLIGLTFTGGCILVALFCAPLCWSLSHLSRLLCLCIIVIIPLFFMEKLGTSFLREDGVLRWGFMAQIGIFSFGGISLLALAGRHLFQRRDADSLVLFLWIMGTFVFATVINWTVNGRTLLPIAPAAGILLVRFLEKQVNLGRRLAWPLLLSGLASLWVAWADFDLAQSGRRAAVEIAKEYEGAKPVWFQGHWGFGYYMQEFKAKPIDFRRSVIKEGDTVITPYNNTNIQDVRKAMNTVKFLNLAPRCWLTTMSFETGVGFYSDRFGPLPFLIGPVPAERYEISTAAQSLDLMTETCTALLQKINKLLKEDKTGEALRLYQDVLQTKPNWPEVLNNVAWILATHPDRKFRDGNQAVQLAQRAVQLTERKETSFLDTLGAAYAEAGRWPAAVKTMERAVELAGAAGQNEMAIKLRTRLEAYRSKQLHPTNY